MSEQWAFIRDDDAGPLTPELKAVAELLVELRVPCLYAAVPAYLSRETASYLGELRAKYPELVEINQHGFLHEQVIGGRHRYSEFGGGRPFEEQRMAIAEGRAIMEALFASGFAREVFTPPSNKFDANTMRALADLGFTILSGLVKTQRYRRAVYQVGYTFSKTHVLGTPISYHERETAGFPLFELSTAIDVDEATNLLRQKLIKDADGLMREFERARRLQRAVGIMLHHATYRTQAKLDTLREFVRRMRSEGVELRSVQAIARDLRVA